MSNALVYSNEKEPRGLAVHISCSSHHRGGKPRRMDAAGALTRSWVSVASTAGQNPCPYSELPGRRFTHAARDGAIPWYGTRSLFLRVFAGY